MGRSPNGQHTLDFSLWDKVTASGKFYDPLENAKAAMALVKAKESGLTPWAGSKYMPQGIKPTSVIFDEFDTVTADAAKTWNLDGVKLWELTLSAPLTRGEYEKPRVVWL